MTEPKEPLISAFTSGEISPKAKGRVDLTRYTVGAAKIFNYVVLPQGGVYRRSGTRYVGQTKYSGSTNSFTRLIEFIFSQSQSYILEFGNGYIRFYRNGAQLTSGGSPVEVATPYAAADLPLLKYCQSADLLYLTHPSYPPTILSRTSDTSWSFYNVPFSDGPYQDQNYAQNVFYPNVTMTTDALTGSVNIASSVTLFQPSDVGRFIQLFSVAKAQWGVILLTTYVNAAAMQGIVQYALGDLVPTSKWALGAFSVTSGYPGCVTFHNERLVFANTPTQPQTFFMSNTSDFYNFTPVENHTTTVVDDNAVVYTIASKEVNAIQWMNSGASNLLMGTNGAEWRVEAGTSGGVITPTSIQVLPQTTYGSSPLTRAVRVSYSILYVTRSKRRLREMNYQFAIDGFVSNDISILGEHLFRFGKGVVDLCYQSEPDGLIWFVRNDGDLIAFTYLKEENILAFAHHQLAPTIGGNALVISCNSIPSVEEDQDQTWFVVQRVVNGQTVQYIEYLEVPFDPGDPEINTGLVGTTAATNAYFVDAGLSYSGSPVNSVSGLNHLIGETVSIIADGSMRQSQVVSGSGSVSVTGPAASNISVGLPFSSVLKTLVLESGSRLGTVQGKTKRPQRFVVRLLNTLGMEVSADGVNYVPYSFRDTDNLMDSPPPLFTGDTRKYTDNDYDFYGQFYFRQTAPYPSTILAVFPEEVVS